MSGMQKEDLDVSLLRKLQRNNVNIGDMSNQQLRQECTAKSKGLYSVVEDNTDGSLTIKARTAITTEDPLKGSNMETILYYLKTRHKFPYILDRTTTTTTEYYLDIREISKSTKDYKFNQPKINMKLLEKYIQVETNNRTINMPDEVTETNEHNNIGDNDTKVVIKNAYDTKDIEIMNKIFNNYLSQRQITSTTETIKHSIDIKNVYGQIKEIISNPSSFGIKEDKPSETYRDTGSYIPRTQQLTLNEQTRTAKSNTEKENIYELLNKMQEYKSLYNFENKNSNINNSQEKISDMVTQRNQIKYKEIPLNKSDSNTKFKEKALTPKLVREIAESVKDAIIKDLRKELSHIYFKPTERSTVIISTTIATTELPRSSTPIFITQEKEKAIIDTFMDLYEKIKALKQTTLFFSAHNKSDNIGNSIKDELKSSIIIPPHITHNNRLRNQDTKVSIFSGGNYNTMQLANPYHYNERQIRNRESPITIQTNSVEIKPLVVPIPRPINLINQNIVVKSKHNFQSKDNPYNMLPLTPLKGTYSNVQNVHTNRSRLYGTSHQNNGDRKPVHSGYQDSMHDGQDIIRFRIKDNGKSKFDADYYEKLNFRNYDTVENSKKNNIDNRMFPKFHEKLEKIDDKAVIISNKDLLHKTEYSDDDVTSRQQTSILNMKKGSSYDDTHFKNFLKTQQKVTDILEKILASGSKTSMPRSVEIY